MQIRPTLRNSRSPSVYLLDDVILPTVSSCIDLGVYMDKRFSSHIDHIVTKAKQRASQILRCFHSTDRNVLCKAFAVYVRPVIEYCSPIWSPCTVTDINKIESVQRTFTKRLSGLRSLPYNERLSLLSIDRVELRRIRADLVISATKLFMV